jgi:hypothetical protein
MLRYNYKIDGYDILKEISGGYFAGKSSPDLPQAMMLGSVLYGYGQMVQFSGAPIFFEAVPEPGAITLASLGFNAEWRGIEKYNNAHLLLAPDPTTKEDATHFMDEFTLDFILDNVNESQYENFVAEWKANYGDAFLAAAEATFQEYGILP